MATAGKASDTEQDWLSLGAASRELGESRLKVLTRAVAGELEAKHLAGQTFISRASLERVRGTAVAST